MEDKRSDLVLAILRNPDIKEHGLSAREIFQRCLNSKISFDIGADAGDEGEEFLDQMVEDGLLIKTDDKYCIK